MLNRTLLLCCLFLPFAAYAEAEKNETPGNETPSVEENIRLMDRDRDGMVSVNEIRVYLESRHGKGYQREVLDGMEASSGPSCSSPFSRSFY